MSPRIDFPDTPLHVTKNPLTSVYGVTPDKFCAACVFLVRSPRSRASKTFYKCMKRKMTSGAATDHRLTWPACGLFEQRQERAT